nr:unnamed protein product [Callosobruchus analis]
MANFISESCANRLGLKRSHISVPIEGLNNMSSSFNKGASNCIIKPVDQDLPTYTFEVIILPQVCSPQPKVNIDVSQWRHIHNLKLADSNFNSPGKIDLLLGAELVPYMLGPGRIFGDNGQPVAIESIFGWVFQGKTLCRGPVNLLSCHVSLGPSLGDILQQFWDIEQVPEKTYKFSSEDKGCEEFFRNTYYREDSGRFVVSLPFKSAVPEFGDTYHMTLRRFNFLESRLLKHPERYQQYLDFMHDYLQSGHMSLVPSSEVQSPTAFYLPHHCVYRPESTSTPLRVVFDCSAKGSKGISLNETLFTGPKLHQELPIILLRFRTFPIAFISDIKQMFRNILIAPQFRDFQRILWRSSPHEPIAEYRLNTVTFGFCCSPFLALRTLKELAVTESHRFPRAAEILENSVFVDDIVSGANDISEALKLQGELISLLKCGGFELKKWMSNVPDLLQSVSQSVLQTPLSFDKEGPHFVKVLGLQWHPSEDIFTYAHNATQPHCTKRSILSDIAKIFDPLGLIAPITLWAKHVMQRLWLSKISWDEAPAADLISDWNRFSEELPCLSQIRIARRCTADRITRIELHAFCDASQKGYAAVVYLRVGDSKGIVRTYLIAAKARVAPLKTLSLPRLELMGAVLLTDLVSFIQRAYEGLLFFDATYAWSDSRVTLCWLSASPHRWRTFVANRVAQVQSIVPSECWHYVPSAENPADCASRGLLPSQLLAHPLWWTGPPWLRLSNDNWPDQSPLNASSVGVDLEQKATVLATYLEVSETDVVSYLLNRSSSLQKVKRVLAYILRFPKRARQNADRSYNPLSEEELQQALYKIVQHVQQECFSFILVKLKANSLLPKPFRRLAPFVDSGGLLRVGGRLQGSQFSYERQHPLLLPKKNRLTDLVVEEVHRKYMHPGFQTLHYLILQQFWILSPRSAIYRCLSRCIRCFRCKPKAYTPIMGNLPSFRVSQLKPFSQITVDYAGPFSVTMGRIRGAKTFKAYICVFVCGATKAIHLELASDLTTEAFLAAFRRFVSRRGRCTDVYSDQGTNFIGAYNQMKEFAKVASEKLSLKWHFNPPASPHFNGLSEAGVKSVKTHLRRVVGDQTMTYEELYTLLSQIEALLNSRPLTPLSMDPNDLSALTPGHFLTMEPLNSPFPEPDVSHLHMARLNRWQLIQKMHNDFWKRWHAEYLHTLQQRCKWDKSIPETEEGTLVLITNELKPPLQWQLARIIRLHPGHDKVARVATVKTVNGTMQRPIAKLCPLPLYE